MEHNVLSAVLESPMAITSGHEHTLSDQEIIELHVRFLTNGFQHIQVPNVEEGRVLMGKLLKSLDYYHTISCLTESDIPLFADVQDLFTYLIEGRYLPHNLEQFFLDYNDFDFLWLELSPNLLDQPWLEEFKSLLMANHIHMRMPIMCISYDSKD
jgi:hypothetical protein